LFASEGSLSKKGFNRSKLGGRNEGIRSAPDPGLCFGAVEAGGEEEDGMDDGNGDVHGCCCPSIALCSCSCSCNSLRHLNVAPHLSHVKLDWLLCIDCMWDRIGSRHGNANPHRLHLYRTYVWSLCGWCPSSRVISGFSDRI
jgi:hypothetical protein